MFNSIKYRFIAIYFLLLLICMSIVGALIINRLTFQQINSSLSNMNQTIDTFASSSSNFSEGSWLSEEKRLEITKSISGLKLSFGESLYAISAGKNPKIIASTSTTKSFFGDDDALSYKDFDPSIILRALKGEDANSTVINENTNLKEKHLAKPVFSSNGDVLGLIYMTEDLRGIYSVIDDAKIIITYATIIGLVITTALGYLISSSITEPIANVTKKAQLMAKGDFDQFVEVKSNDEIGDLGSMFNYLTNELKSTIGQMNLEKSKLNTIFNYMAEGVIALDKNGYLIHANPIARSILSIPENYEKTKMDLSILNITKINYLDSKTLEGESESTIGNKFYKVKYAPYKKNRIINLGLIVVLQDMTKEHVLDNMRREFVANVSHELKTPITTIKTYSETILDSNMDREEAKHFLKIINRENDRMGRIVSDLLSLSSIDYKSYNFKYENIDSYEILNEALESLSLLIKNKNHKVELDVPLDINDIYADRGTLERILVNIISNAIKYTPENGLIEVKASQDRDFIKIKVKDNGIGIPKEDLNRIFERFYRVEKGRSRAMGGTGLGLSIAKELTIAMGGSILLSSKYKKGTIVELKFKGAKN